MYGQTRGDEAMHGERAGAGLLERLSLRSSSQFEDGLPDRPAWMPAGRGLARTTALLCATVITMVTMRGCVELASTSSHYAAISPGSSAVP
jgi:hypothetical protein